jgi:hypothetical protein
MKTPIHTCLLLLLIVLASCDKEHNYPEDSIIGTWRCQEVGSVYNARQYNVNIDFTGQDSSMITIYNFYNLGFGVETYALVEDTIITFLGTDSFEHFFSGMGGRIERDFSAIYWEFSYSGTHEDPLVEAVYRRP